MLILYLISFVSSWFCTVQATYIGCLERIKLIWQLRDVPDYEQTKGHYLFMIHSNILSINILCYKNSIKTYFQNKVYLTDTAKRPVFTASQDWSPSFQFPTPLFLTRVCREALHKVCKTMVHNRGTELLNLFNLLF